MTRLDEARKVLHVLEGLRTVHQFHVQPYFFATFAPIFSSAGHAVAQSFALIQARRERAVLKERIMEMTATRPPLKK